jgi:hypothetical protein
MFYFTLIWAGQPVDNSVEKKMRAAQCPPCHWPGLPDAKRGRATGLQEINDLRPLLGHLERAALGRGRLFLLSATL